MSAATRRTPFFPYGFPLWTLLSPFSLPLPTFDDRGFFIRKKQVFSFVSNGLFK